MRILLICFLVMSFMTNLFANGGVYDNCNGQSWHASPVPGKYYGKVCIHCRDGSHVKLLTRYSKGGAASKYYTLDKRFVAEGSSARNAIYRVCK